MSEVQAVALAKAKRMGKLEHKNIWELDLLSKKSVKWVRGSGTPAFVSEYLDNIRTPSHRWNMSYFNALLTKKFLKAYATQAPEEFLKVFASL